MTDRTYNGWTNYETWSVALWIDNDAETQSAAHALARAVAHMIETGGDWQQMPDIYSAADEAAYVLGAALREQHEDAAYELTGSTASVLSDLLGAALREVAWTEVARSILADVEPVKADQ